MKKDKTAVGSAILVMIVVLGSKFLGFLRQIVIASTYGSDINTDIYFMSSDFMIGLSGALLASLTTALVTMYIDICVKKDRESANSVASKMLTLFLTASVVFIAVINIFAPFIARVLAPTYNTSDHALLVKYLRIFSVTFIFTAFQSIYSAVLNANNSFVPGKLYGIVYNPIAIVCVLAFAGKYGIKALVFAYFVGNILQTILLRQLCKNTFSFHPSLKFRDENIRHLILLSVPLLLSNIFIQLNGIVDKSISSYLGEGYASNYSYAYTLEQFITATITATVSLILLSKYASYVARGDTDMVVLTFRKSLSGLIILLAPITIVTCALAYRIVAIVYMRGEFDSISALHTSHALIGFGVGFTLIAIRELYIRLHFSYQDTKMPMIANISAVGLNAVLSIILAKFVGILGVSLATSLSVILTISILNRSVKRYIPDFRFASILPLITKVVIACAASLLCAVSSNNLINAGNLLCFLISAALSLATYVAILALLRCSEFFELAKDIARQLMYRLGR